MDKKLRSKSHDDLPASVGLVKAIRSELRSEIRAVSKRIDSVDKKIDSVEKKIDSVGFSMESRFLSLESRFDATDAKIESGQATTDRMLVLMEEQRSENRIVMDALKTVLDRQERMERVFPT